MEIKRINNEIYEKEKIEKTLKSVLKNRSSLKLKVNEEIITETKKFGDERKTIIKESNMASMENQILDEPATVVVSTNGWVRYKLGYGHKIENFTFKASDLLLNIFECRTIDYLIGLSNIGRAFSVSVSNLPAGKGTGLPYNTFIDLQSGESVKCFMSTNENSDVLVITKNGQGFRTKFGSMITRNKGGKSFINHQKDDCPKFILTLQELNEGLAIITSMGFLLVFGTNQIKTLLSGGKGVNLIKLHEGDFIAFACIVPEKGLVLNTLSNRGSKKIFKLSRDDLSAYVSNRGRRGKKIKSKFKIISIN